MVLMEQKNNWNDVEARKMYGELRLMNGMERP